MKTMKFSDMPQGTHFTDGQNKFIKLWTVLPSGLPINHRAFSGKTVIREVVNAIHYDGCSATVPDWREYRVFLPSI